MTKEKTNELDYAKLLLETKEEYVNVDTKGDEATILSMIYGFLRESDNLSFFVGQAVDAYVTSLQEDGKKEEAGKFVFNLIDTLTELYQEINGNVIQIDMEEDDSPESFPEKVREALSKHMSKLP